MKNESKYKKPKRFQSWQLQPRKKKETDKIPIKSGDKRPDRIWTRPKYSVQLTKKRLRLRSKNTCPSNVFSFFFTSALFKECPAWTDSRPPLWRFNELIATSISQVIAGQVMDVPSHKKWNSSPHEEIV